MSSSNQQLPGNNKRPDLASQKQLQTSIIPSASLPLQSTLFFEYRWSWIYFIIEIFIFIFKKYYFLYPNDIFTTELIAMICMIFIQYIKIDMGSVGNKTESSGIIIWHLILSVPMILCFIYFMVGQSYVLEFEVILNAISIFFSGLGFILAIIALIKFGKAEKNN